MTTLVIINPDLFNWRKSSNLWEKKYHPNLHDSIFNCSSCCIKRIKVLFLASAMYLSSDITWAIPLFK